VTWISPVSIIFVVDKASPNLTVEGRSKYFDNEKFEYTVSGSKLIGFNNKAPELSLKDEFVDISYFKQVSGAEFEEVDEMRDAATYRVKVQLNKAFEESNPNYVAETVYATYTILKLIVNVTISANGYVPSETSTGLLLLGAMFEKGKTYKIDYTVAMAGSVSNSISIIKAQTDVVFASDITNSGRYPFSIEIVDSKIDKNNYSLVGANGVLELTTRHISTTNAAVDLENDVVANRLVANEVYSSSASASDMDLWLKVEQYMPVIGDRASLAAMVRLELYYGSSVVSLNGATATIEVDIPKEIGGMDDIAIYMVTAEGGLKRLTDYTITSDGKIRYTTDYLGDLMFVNLKAQLLPLWAIILIAVASGVMVITLAVAGVCLIIRKRNLHRLV
ncbi:MAG: hypothetical protein K2G31_01955, partial [Clostridia bacterium]|nr:hypothetical protein [Clostridia bacterium]